MIDPSDRFVPTREAIRSISCLLTRRFPEDPPKLVYTTRLLAPDDYHSKPQDEEREFVGKR
jgi:hypothetical protein